MLDCLNYMHKEVKLSFLCSLTSQPWWLYSIKTNRAIRESGIVRAERTEYSLLSGLTASSVLVSTTLSLSPFQLNFLEL